MKKIWKGLIVLAIGLLMGAVMGFIGLQRYVWDVSFLQGFIAGFILLAVGMIFLFVWNRSLRRGADGSSEGGVGYAFSWILISVFIVLGGIFASLTLMRQQEIFQTQAENQRENLRQQFEMTEAMRTSSLVVLMGDLLEQVEEEVTSNPGRKLSPETIARVAALSFSFQPHAVWEEEGLSDKKFSGERGQLLLALCLMDMDSASFARIKSRSTFAGADLRGVDLSAADLGGADLNGANFKEAQLDGTQFSGADLKDAILWGATLNQANFEGAELKRADLSWAELNGVNLKAANLNGADLTSSKLRKADASGADFQYAELNGAFLTEASLTDVNFTGTDFRQANLTRANLTGSTLYWTKLSEATLNYANMTGVKLEKATIAEENWFEKLIEWEVTGAEEAPTGLKIVKDNAPQFNYRIEKDK